MFDYIENKISTAKILQSPFEHIYIKNVFTQRHWDKLVGSDMIGLQAGSTQELFDVLHAKGYRSIPFPGAIQSEEEYLMWERDSSSVSVREETCESMGMVFRLQPSSDEFISSLQRYFQSPPFIQSLKQKFGIAAQVDYDFGIQKYLNGYEISPHPDTRRKALTLMLNINPFMNSEGAEIHTQYCRFDKKYEYVYDLWDVNTSVDRSWVPWSWVKTEYEQRENNSLVIFAPNSRTLHAVRARYSHCEGQRTQLYANLWYREFEPLPVPSYRDLEKAKGLKINSNKSIMNAVVTRLKKMRR